MKNLKKHFILANVLTFGLVYSVLNISLASVLSSGAQVLSHYPELVGSRYKAMDTTGKVGDTVLVPIRFGTSNSSATNFDMFFNWNKDSLQFLNQIPLSADWPAGWSLSTPTVKEESLHVYATGSAYQFDSLKTIFSLKFRIVCIPANGGNATVRNLNEDQSSHRSHFVAGGQTWEPELRRNAVVSNPLVDNALVSASMESTIIDNTAQARLFYTTNFQPVQGCSLRVSFDSTKLQYQGIETIGTALVGKTVTVNGDGEGIRVIKTPDSISKGNNSVLVKVKLKNIMTQNREIGNVFVPYAKFKSCGLDSAVYTQASPSNEGVTTFYTARAYIGLKTSLPNTLDSIQVVMANNFIVDMNTSQDLEARFRFNTNWPHLTFKGIRNIGQYKWDTLNVGDGSYVVFEDRNQTSDDIPISSSTVPIFWIKYQTSSDTGVTDTIKFVAATIGFWTKIDNRLKVKSRPITIHSVNSPPGDSTLYLTKGWVTIRPPSGGGCPFLYVWNGSSFEEDNSLLTQSEYSAKEQTATDYYLIQKPLIDKDKQYHVQLRELADEKSFIDKIELLTVDHPQGQRIGVTTEGKIFQLVEELTPVSVVDDRGEDQKDKLIARDEIFYTSDKPGALVLTFAVPHESRKGPFVFGGPSVTKRPGADGGPRISPNAPREPKLELLKTEIQDQKGDWIELAQAPPRDNYAENHWLIDPSQIQLGETVKIRISWQKCYAADEIKFYSVKEQIPIATTLSLSSGSHSNTGSVTKLVSSEDYQFVTLVRGEKLDLFFPARNLPLPEGYSRDFIVKASGYYIPYSPKPTASIPDRFELKDNYPNPFNTTTEISYSIPFEVEVQLTIYNIMGQKVRTLVEGIKSLGFHKVTWDGTDDSGESVASGIYFYLLKAGIYSETKKMTLLK